MLGPCAKATVACTIATQSGINIIRTNACNNAQEKCPRLPGEGYEKCTTVCDQQGHAEIQALRAAGPMARHADVFLSGHTYYCRECQEALFKAGVRSIAIVK